MCTHELTKNHTHTYTVNTSEYRLKISNVCIIYFRFEIKKSIYKQKRETKLNQVLMHTQSIKAKFYK